MDTNELARKRIFDMIDENGISLSDFAMAIGVTLPIVSHWKYKRSSSFVKHLPEIAKYFGVTVEYLTGQDEDSEAFEILSEFKGRSEMRQLFKAAKGATKQDIERTTKIIEALKNSNPDSNEFWEKR